MKRSAFISLMVAGLMFAGCSGQGDTAGDDAAQAGYGDQTETTAGGANMAAGTVEETMNTAGYTYVKVATDKGSIWAAATEFKVEVGDKVIFPTDMPMKDYHSTSLDRTFDLIYFTSSMQLMGAGGAAGGEEMPPGHPETGSTAEGTPAHPGVEAGSIPEDVDLSKLKKASGGYTIEEVFSQKAALAGKNVAVRGVVVKYTPGIMGKNWIHVQDGTGTAPGNDLTVTTDGSAAVGNTVLVTGPVSVNKDFGAGYAYDVIIENAKVIIE